MNSFFTRNPLANLVFFIALVNLYFGSIYYFKDPPRWGNTFYSDSEGYYIYLPAVFIYDGFMKVPFFSGSRLPDGKALTKYTSGVALMEMPFFLAAHTYSQLMGYPSDGYTAVYAFSILLAATFYGSWGLYLLGNFLRKRFTLVVALVSIAALYFGTNLMYYMMKEPGLSHVYSFFLFSALLVLFTRYLKAPRKRIAFLAGLISGIIILIRPTNIILALLLPLWDVRLFAEFKARINFFLAHPAFIIFMVVGPVLIFLPQLMYWYSMTGSIFIYTYKEEGFIYWNNPKIFEVLLGVQNGWLVYSPVMIFSLAGLAAMIWKRVNNAWLILALFGLATYTFASWWAWWFGGAYGHRCYVDYLPLMAIPLACFFHLVMKKKRWIKMGIFTLTILFCYYNIGLTYWYSYTAPWDGPEWNWEKFGVIVQQLFDYSKK